MSVYSGFSTRQQEKDYNKILYHLVNVIQFKNISMITNLQKFLNKLWSRLSQMDECKYLVPRFSNSMQELAEFFNIKTKKRHKSHMRKPAEHYESFDNDKNEEEPERIPIVLKPKRLTEKPNQNILYMKPNLSVINEGSVMSNQTK